MPRYMFINDSRSAVPLPPPLSGLVPPQSNVEIETEAVNVDTPLMKKILRHKLLRMLVTTNAPSIPDHIEIPVVDMLESGGLLFRGRWVPGLTYQPFDVVQFNGTSWVALQASTGVSPVEGLDWTALGDTSASSGWDRIGVQLTTSDGRLFNTPENFEHVASKLTIEVFDGGGRRLRQATAASPALGDYYVDESAGAGTGFNQVRLLTFSASSLIVNYKAA